MSKQVLLGITGSIAAYKSAELVRLIKKQGWDVSVVMTKAATHFIGPLTLQTLSRKPVAVEMFPERVEWEPEHIALATKADVFLIAPCTANVIAKIAHGIADDLLTCTALACKAPLVIAPAMNEAMWEHPATQANVALLRRRGVRFVDPSHGELACGWEGRGRMAEPDAVVDYLAALRQGKGKGRK